MKKIFWLSLMVSIWLNASTSFSQDATPLPVCSDPLPHSIAISPVIAHVIYGGDVDFRAYAYDESGKLIKDFSPTSWEASSGIMDDQGHYVANITGYHEISAHYECLLANNGTADPIYGISGNASVHVGEPRPR